MVFINEIFLGHRSGLLVLGFNSCENKHVFNLVFSFFLFVFISNGFCLFVGGSN
jgi:F0F1-type ATP synthase membrane subunit a